MSESEVFDLSKFDVVGGANKGSRMFLRNPATDSPFVDKDKKPNVWIDLLGADSDVYRTAQFEQSDEQLSKIRPGKKLQLRSEDLADQSLEIIARCVKDWNLTENGKRIPTDLDSVRRVLIKNPWIKKQCSEFIEEPANYLGN